MKNLYKNAAFLVLLITSIGFYSCSVNVGNKNEDETDKTGVEYTSAYICPMHCEGSGDDEAGTCPVCKMDYVKNENASEEVDGDEGEEESSSEVKTKEYTSVYICPMYCEGSGSDEAGVCPVCAMDYVLNENPSDGTEQEEESHHHEH